jgi:hypothetical protein
VTVHEATDDLSAGADGDEIVFNGISGATGGYPFARTTVADLAAMARGVPLEAAPLRRAARWLRSKLEIWRDTRDAFSASRLEEAGWGVIFAAGCDPRIRAALRPLLDWRRAAAGAVEPRRCRELWEASGYRQGESMRRFLLRHDAELGAADPRQLPYYLLLVGGPEEIPFSFQYDLDLRHAVGRLDLETPEAYAAYAASVVGTEKAWTAREGTGGSPGARRAAFFCPSNSDRISRRMRHELVDNLLARLASEPATGWQLLPVVDDGATREELQSLLGGAGKPDFLFTACHGLVFPANDKRQRDKQGALLCRADAAQQPLEAAVAASDITDEACPSGLIALHFACYSAGTPARDDFGPARSAIAPQAFTARLPQRLLGHPRGGALAVIGHVERAWTHSFTGYGKAPQLNTFEDLIRRLLRGETVGRALELINFRHAEMAVELLTLRERAAIEPASDARDALLASVYCAAKDARNYVVLGDPAVRLYPGEAPTRAGGQA